MNIDGLWEEVRALQQQYIAQAIRLGELHQFRRLEHDDSAVDAAQARLDQIQTRWRAAIETLGATLDNDNSGGNRLMTHMSDDRAWQVAASVRDTSRDRETYAQGVLHDLAGGLAGFAARRPRHAVLAEWVKRSAAELEQLLTT